MKPEVRTDMRGISDPPVDDDAIRGQRMIRSQDVLLTVPQEIRNLELDGWLDICADNEGKRGEEVRVGSEDIGWVLNDQRGVRP